ncbi:MAG: cytochrome d ubiquinol oxidase subunit II [Candidatus Aminicenantia bacterium]
MTEHEIIRIIWFSLIGFLLAVYSIPDGFDMKSGIIYHLLPKNGEKKVFKAIGPFQDRNEGWLLT